MWVEGILERAFDTVSLDISKLRQEREAKLITADQLCSHHASKSNKALKATHFLTPHDWFVFDCGTIPRDPAFLLYLERVFCCVENRRLNMPDGREVRFQQQNNFVFEMPDLRNLSPRVLSGFNIVHVQQEVFNMTEEFENWTQSIKQGQP